MPRTCSSSSRLVWSTSNCSHRPSRCRSEHSITSGPDCPPATPRDSTVKSAPRSRSGSNSSNREPMTSSARYPSTRSIDGLWYSTVPSAETTVIRSLERATSELKRASDSRRCRSSVSAALSSASDTLVASDSQGAALAGGQRHRAVDDQLAARLPAHGQRELLGSTASPARRRSHGPSIVGRREQPCLVCRRRSAVAPPAASPCRSRRGRPRPPAPGPPRAARARAAPTAPPGGPCRPSGRRPAGTAPPRRRS